jgi:cytochrome c biogenesis protein ResB
MNSMHRLFGDDGVYVFTYGNTKLVTDFKIQLENFKVGQYEGISMAKSYESQVRLDGVGSPIVISMNDPLKHRGFTFYQSSFQEDETGKPTISVLSVNQDPGRWVKYLGCIILISGIILLFSMRNQARKAQQKPPGSAPQKQQG